MPALLPKDLPRGLLGAETVIAGDIGLGFAGQRQGLRRFDRRRLSGFAVREPVQQVQDVRFRGRACLQGHFGSHEHGLLIVVEHERKDFHHLLVTAGLAVEMAPQLSESVWQFGKGRAVAQCAGLALDHRQIMLSVINRMTMSMVRAVDDPPMLTEHSPLGDDDDPLGINPQTDWTIGERGRHAVAVALEMNEAGW